MSSQKAIDWEVVKPLLEAMFIEFKQLSRKRADGAVNKSKIASVNRLLTKCRAILADEPSIEFLDLVEEDNVPQNSDVVLVLSQYEAAMNQFRETYWDRYKDDWDLDDETRGEDELVEDDDEDADDGQVNKR